MPVSHQDHRGIPVAPSVSRAGFHQPLDLGLSQVLAGAQLAIRGPLEGNCSIYGSRRDQREVAFGHALHAPALMTVRIIILFLSVRQRES